MGTRLCDATGGGTSFSWRVPGHLCRQATGLEATISSHEPFSEGQDGRDTPQAQPRSIPFTLREAGSLPVPDLSGHDPARGVASPTTRQRAGCERRFRAGRASLESSTDLRGWVPRSGGPRPPGAWAPRSQPGSSAAAGVRASAPEQRRHKQPDAGAWGRGRSPPTAFLRRGRFPNTRRRPRAVSREQGQ